jgi:hypothetical protein
VQGIREESLLAIETPLVNSLRRYATFECLSRQGVVCRFNPATQMTQIKPGENQPRTGAQAVNFPARITFRITENF